MAFSNQIVLLVGGRGTRLGALTSNTPKPMMQISDEKVFLDFLIENCVRQGFGDIILLAGHLGDQIKRQFDNRRIGGCRVSVIVEPSALGTGGALKFAAERLAPTFLVANGDTLFDVNMRALDVSLHRNPDIDGMIALRDNDDAGRFGSVSLSPNNRVLSFSEKDPRSQNRRGLINGGVYALRRSMIESLPDGPCSIESDVFTKLVEAGRLGGQILSGYFLDIGLPETLDQSKRELPHRKRPVLFLDRDGVVNIDKGYLFKIEDFEWIDGAIELIKRHNDLGHAVIVVTNQAGVARGYYEEGDVLRLHAHIQNELKAEGAFIDEFYYCPYHEDAGVERYKIAHHPDRKPRAGMIEKAFHDHSLDRSRAILIGDQQIDLLAASEAGIEGALYVSGNIADFAARLSNKVLGR